MKINRTKIEMLQAERGLTAGELAEKADTCRQTISALKGRGTCSPLIALRIARALGVDMAEILAEEE